MRVLHAIILSHGWRAAFAGPVPVADETETRIRDLEQRLSTTADDAQLANVDLQNMPQKQQMLQMFSQMSKMMSDTAMAVPCNIG